MSDLISRADAIEAVCRTRCGDKAKGCPAHSCLVIEEFDALPSADAESDDLIIKGAKGIQDGLYNIKDGKLFMYKANGGTVRTYPIVPSAEPTEDYSDLPDIPRAYYEKIVGNMSHEINMLKEQLESADAVHGWRIGKPTEQGKYMVTIDSFGHKHIDLFYYGKPMMPNRKVRGKCWYRSDDEWGDVVYDDTDILAWQPLPTPYKGGDTE